MEYILLYKFSPTMNFMYCYIILYIFIYIIYIFILYYTIYIYIISISSLHQVLIFFPSLCYIWSSCNKENNKIPFLMQKMSLKLWVNSKGILTALVTGKSDDEEMKKGVHAGRYV